MPDWAKLTKQEKELYAHEMEVYAAYLTYVDHYIGELVAFLEEMGQLDNTLIITVSDNGASPEGGPERLVQREPVLQQRAATARS